MFAWLYEFWWVLLLGIAIGAVLLLVVISCLVWLEGRKQERAWEERKRLEVDNSWNRTVQDLRSRLHEVERQQNLDKGNIEYLQAQNAGQARDIETLQDQVVALLGVKKPSGPKHV